MKKLFTILFVFSILFSANLMAGMPINESALPKNSLSFIKTYFPNATITYAEKDNDDYEVKLSDGVEINFLLNGEWKDVKAYSALPTGFIPANVLSTVKKNYADAVIVEVEKKYGNFKVKLNNMMELYINAQGTLMKQKFDD